ncbi:MAG TPA: type II secretion system protein GspM, partial [Roseateles sp.]
MARPALSSKAGNGFPAQWAQARAQATAQWQALGERERLLVGGVAVLLGLLLVWLVLVAPALRTLRSAPAELDRLEL